MKREFVIVHLDGGDCLQLVSYIPIEGRSFVNEYQDTGDELRAMWRAEKSTDPPNRFSDVSTDEAILTVMDEKGWDFEIEEFLEAYER